MHCLISFVGIEAIQENRLYRKDIFDKYGITVPKTMDQLLGTAEKLTMDWNADGKVDLTGRNWVTRQPEYLDLAGGYNYGNFLPCFTKGMKIARGDYLGTQIGGVPVPEAVEVVKTTHVEMSSAIAGEKTVEQAMKDAARLIEKTMRKAGYYR